MNMQNSQAVVQKLWKFCRVLRDDGLSYPDYVEQLTFLLFLKMVDERSGDIGPNVVPEHLGWKSLLSLRGGELHRQYSLVLEKLGHQPGTLGIIFHNAQNKIKDPLKLQKLIIDQIDSEDWSSLSWDVKGDAYEGLLDRTAQDAKSGAGQYFTPRALVEAIVEAIAPKLGETICDPACGTGGFLLAAKRFITSSQGEVTSSKQHQLQFETFFGSELVDSVARLGAMNLVLHGIGPIADEADASISVEDSLSKPPSRFYDVVLTNPPFGKHSSLSLTLDNEEESDLQRSRTDLPFRTSNKQMNFLQHCFVMLKPGGRAAVVVPDNVLFESGTSASIRRFILENSYLHTLLRLPTGIFYAQGVKSNVLFFDKRQRKESFEDSLWIYDLRSDMRVSLKTRPLHRDDLNDFLHCYGDGSIKDRIASPSGDGRWASIKMQAILDSADAKLDLSAAQGAAILSEDYDPEKVLKEIRSHVEEAVAELVGFEDIFRPR